MYVESTEILFVESTYILELKIVRLISAQFRVRTV